MENSGNNRMESQKGQDGYRVEQTLNSIIEEKDLIILDLMEEVAMLRQNILNLAKARTRKKKARTVDRYKPIHGPITRINID